MKRTPIPALAIVLAAMAIPATAQDIDVGQDSYQQYCATCHGPGGDGGGPMADMMTAKVPDLTTLSARNDGAFPMLDVIHIIDGRTGLRAHGGPMPVYGAIFKQQMASAAPYGDVLFARGQILSLAYYLETLQK